MVWKHLCIFLYFSFVCCQVSLRKQCCIVGSHSIFDLHISLYSFFRLFQSASHFLLANTLMVFITHCAFTLTLSICSSQFNLLSRVISRNWVLFLSGIVWFLSVISIGSLFLFLNIIFTVLLVGRQLHLVFPPLKFPVLSVCSVIQKLIFLIVVY